MSLSVSAPLPTLLTSLPEVELRCRIFLQLSVKERARACCVCRAWRQAVDGDSALWEALDLGTEPPLAVLRGAVARAQGLLRSLTVFSSITFTYDEQFLREGVVPVLERSPLLRHLRLTADGSVLDRKYVWKPNLELVARAGTQLETLACSVFCRGAEEALALLTRQTPFGALQLEGLEVFLNDDENALVEILGANLGQQPSLLHFSLHSLCIPPLHNSTPLFDSLLASQITSLAFHCCDLSVDFVAGLARVLQAGRLERLDFDYSEGMFTSRATAQLLHALRHSRTLLAFKISYCQGVDAVLDLILLALQSHPTLEALTLGNVRYSAAARDVLLRLIAADSPTLRMLHLWGLREDELRLSAVAGALQQNCHLQYLLLDYGDEDDEDNDESLPTPAAYEEHLLPAVLACTSLRTLTVNLFDEPAADGAAVVQLVADREAARLAAELAKEPGRSA